MHTVPLQDMVDGVIKEANARLSNQTEVPPSDTPSGPPPDTGALDLDEVEKLACAAEYIVEHFDEVVGDGMGVRDLIKTKLAAPNVKGTHIEQPGATSGLQSARFGGKKTIPTNPPMEDGTKLKDNKGAMLPAYPAEGPIRKLSQAERTVLKRAILDKLASGVDNPVRITGKPSSGPPGVFASGGGPGAASAPGRQFVSSAKAATDYTKGDAKKTTAYPDVHKVLDEHRLNRSTDPVLHENLQNASTAGVKIAGVRGALTKIATAGCGCEGQGTCAHCQMARLTPGLTA